MRMHRLVAVVVAMLSAAPAMAQSPANAVWATDNQNRVYRWDGREFAPVPGGMNMKQVSVGADGEVWGVDPSDNAHRWTGAGWQAIPASLRQVSVRNRSEVWAITPSNRLFRRNATGTGWDPVDTPSGIRHVSVGGDGSVWMVDGDGNLAQRENNAWKPVPCLITSGVLRRDGTTWTITRSIGDPTPSPGVPCARDSLKLKKVWSTDAQKVFGVDERGLLARLTGTGWYFFESGRSDVAYSADGELWITSGSVFFSKDQMASWERMQPFDVAFQSIAVGAAAPSPPAPPSESGLSPAEEQETLAAHNSERQNYSAYGVGPLQWSPQLARYAREWAQKLADEASMVHRPNYGRDNPFKPNESAGENIYGAASSGAQAVQSWASEKQWYHYDLDDGMASATNAGPGCTAAPPSTFCGHFTQVVWKNTQYVGCGRASAPNGGRFICNYYPAGNYTGQKPY
jgi:pathogenesis-related protein 1